VDSKWNFEPGRGYSAIQAAANSYMRFIAGESRRGVGFFTLEE